MTGVAPIITEGCLVYEIEAEAAGTYTIYTYGTEEAISIKAYLGALKYDLEDGADEASYYPESEGYFQCEVTFGNGAKENSNTVALEAHEHKDSDENYVCDECSEELPGKPDVNDDLDGDEGGLPENPDVNDDLDGDDGGFTVGAIVAIIVSSVVAVALIAVAVIVIIKKKR
jgi:hypothetical protein